MNLSINQSKIVDVLMNTGTVATYMDLMEATELPRTTVIDNLETLLRNGIILKGKRKENATKGRPTTIWWLK